MATRTDDRVVGSRTTALRRPVQAGVAVSVALLLIVIVAAVWLVAGSGGDGREPANGPAGGETLQWVVGGIPQPLPSAVPLAGDLSASIALTPDQERYARTVEVSLFDAGASAAGVDGATIQATATMLLMDHGTLVEEAIPAGGGRYLLPLRFEMPGEWQIVLEVATGQEHATVVLTLEVWT